MFESMYTNGQPGSSNKPDMRVVLALSHPGIVGSATHGGRVVTAAGGVVVATVLGPAVALDVVRVVVGGIVVGAVVGGAVVMTTPVTVVLLTGPTLPLLMPQPATAKAATPTRAMRPAKHNQPHSAWAEAADLGAVVPLAAAWASGTTSVTRSADIPSPKPKTCPLSRRTLKSSERQPDNLPLAGRRTFRDFA